MGCLWWSYVLTQPQNTATWLRTASEIDCVNGLSPIGGIDLASQKKGSVFQIRVSSPGKNQSTWLHDTTQ